MYFAKMHFLLVVCIACIRDRNGTKVPFLFRLTWGVVWYMFVVGLLWRRCMDQEELRAYIGLCRTSTHAARIFLVMSFFLFLAWFQVGFPSPGIDPNVIVVWNITISRVSEIVVAISLISYAVIFIITHVVTHMQVKGLLESGQLRPEHIGLFRRPRNNHLFFMLLSGLVLFWSVPHLAVHMRQFIVEDTMLGDQPFVF